MNNTKRTQPPVQMASGLITELAKPLPAGYALAVGNDIVHIPAFIQSCTPLFIRRVYTQNELDYCGQFADKHLRYASTWAAKEAVYKVVKQINGSQKLWWRDIEILRDKPQGKPAVCLKKIQTPLSISLTITHDGEYVWAFAVCISHQQRPED